MGQKQQNKEIEARLEATIYHPQGHKGIGWLMLFGLSMSAITLVIFKGYVFSDDYLTNILISWLISLSPLLLIAISILFYDRLYDKWKKNGDRK